MKKLRYHFVSPSDGKVVYCSWKGRPYIRKKPEHFQDRKSALQLLQREKFQVGVSFLTRVLPIVRMGYAYYSPLMTAYNCALRQIMREAFVVEDGRVRLAFEKVLLGQGSLAVASEVVVRLDDALLQIVWNTSMPLGNADVTDKVLVAVFYPAGWLVTYIHGQTYRGDGYATLTLPDLWCEGEFYVYLGFTNSDLCAVSNVVCVAQLGS